MAFDHCSISVVLEPGAKMPTRAHEYDAGLDLYLATADAVVIPARSIRKVKTGTRVAIPQGYVGKIEGRSSLASLGIIPLGGIIDHGYTGEMIVNFANLGEQPHTFTQDRSIAQLVIYPILTPIPVQVDSLAATARGEGGFGHTDKKG